MNNTPLRKFDQIMRGRSHFAQLIIMRSWSKGLMPQAGLSKPRGQTQRDIIRAYRE